MIHPIFKVGDVSGFFWSTDQEALPRRTYLLTQAVIALAVLGDLPRVMNMAGNPQGGVPSPTSCARILMT
jgi:hypothetical protein